MDEDYYKILEINRDAGEADIQRAYRKLARKYHPDLHPDAKNAKEKFQQVQRAYEVLNDPGKRELYDRYGSAFESMGAGGPGGAGERWQYSPGAGGDVDFDFAQIFRQQGGSPFGGFGDIFKQFGGGGAETHRRAAPRPRGSDLQHQLQVPFNTAITGGEARLVVQRDDGKKESIKVKIPAGIEDGRKIRLRGQGERAAKGATPGDIIISIHVSPHPCFQRRGNNLEVVVPVTVSEAALGAKVDVPTPHGTITLQVPPGTSGGKKLRVRGHGVRTAEGVRGDLYAEIQIMLPSQLSDSDQEFFRQLAERSNFDPRRDLQW